MRGEPVELACPFCDKGRIQCWFIPGAISVKISGARSLPGKTSKHKSSDTWMIQTGCNVCGKSLEEVEKKLREDDII